MEGAAADTAGVATTMVVVVRAVGGTVKAAVRVGEMEDLMVGVATAGEDLETGEGREGAALEARGQVGTGRALQEGASGLVPTGVREAASWEAAATVGAEVVTLVEGGAA